MGKFAHIETFDRDRFRPYSTLKYSKKERWLMVEQKDRCEICKFYEPPERKNSGYCNNPHMLQQKKEGGYMPTAGFPNVSPDHWCGNFQKKDS